MTAVPAEMISYVNFACSPFGPTDCHSPARLLSLARAAADWISAGVAGVFAPIVLEISNRIGISENRLLTVVAFLRKRALVRRCGARFTLSTDEGHENRHLS